MNIQKQSDPRTISAPNQRLESQKYNLAIFTIAVSACDGRCPSSDWFHCMTSSGGEYCFKVTSESANFTTQQANCAALGAGVAILNSQELNEVCVFGNSDAIGEHAVVLHPEKKTVNPTLADLHDIYRDIFMIYIANQKFLTASTHQSKKHC